jgi:hypothetical protein
VSHILDAFTPAKAGDREAEATKSLDSGFRRNDGACVPHACRTGALLDILRDGPKDRALLLWLSYAHERSHLQIRFHQRSAETFRESALNSESVHILDQI